jgi:NTP pyrophosphatase (non-canonical NTP hydrolase)
VTDGEVPERVAASREHIQDELADVVIYAFQFADRMGVDLGEAVRIKMDKNGKKYPTPSR